MAWETISETEIWKPEDVGECRIGEYTDWDPKAGDDGKSNLYSFFDHENDQEWKIWGTTMLTGLMEDVKIGDKIRLEYRGERTSKQGRNYKVFKLQKWVDEDGEDVGGDPSSPSSSGLDDLLPDTSEVEVVTVKDDDVPRHVEYNPGDIVEHAKIVLGKTDDPVTVTNVWNLIKDMEAVKRDKDLLKKMDHYVWNVWGPRWMEENEE